MKQNEKYNLIVSALLTAILLVFNIGVRVGVSWTGQDSSISPGYVEGFAGKFSEIYWNDENRTDTLAYPEQAASYIIFKDGTNICAKNASTGHIDYGGSGDAGGVDGANASVVIQMAIDASPGEVFIKKGSSDYIISVTINAKDDLKILSDGATLKCADDTQITVLEANAKTGVFIDGLIIDGNKANNVQNAGSNDMMQNGIHFYETSNSSIKNCEVKNTVMHGINIHESSLYNLISDNIIKDCGETGGYTTQGGLLLFSNANDNVVVNNRFFDNFYHNIYISAASRNVVTENYMKGVVTEGGTGIVLMSGASGNIVANNKIFDLPGTGIRVFDTGIACLRNQIIGNNIESLSTPKIWMGIFTDNADFTLISENVMNLFIHQGIRLELSSYCIIENNIIKDGGQFDDNTTDAISLRETSTHNTIIGNKIRSTGMSRFRNGISEEDSVDDYNQIYLNDISGIATLAVFKSGANTKVKFNEGFITENSGTVNNSTATTFVFNHGLAGIPDYVWASFNTTAISGYFWTANSTQITITVTGSGLPAIMAPYWKAEYDSA